ncbi:MAG: iron uptake transporter deferrochelatase/peroxidase subunit [Cardiobacteriaceae bacterium]|nr:iron uptake transporter deferrochelatase/peroxidase subunit [Cardiobacteriaceae bacterium]
MSYPRYDRRTLLKYLGVGGAGLATQQALGQAQSALPNQSIDESRVIPFYGQHQAGIISPLQKHVYFIVLDLHHANLHDIRTMFQQWTQYSALLTQGQNIKPYANNGYIPPTDTGEADSLHAHRLTLTFGITPSFLSTLGLESQRPVAFKNLPHFPRDQLKERYTGGDICIQACADDPQVAFHAVRNLVRSARSHVTPRWSQAGFNAFDHANETPRNLFAFKDGTANSTGDDAKALCFVEDDGWLHDGSYLVARRIQMFLETWDRTSANEQNNTFGRNRSSGAAFGEQGEFDALTLENLPEDSHVHLAKKTGRQILRRSFSYASGIDDKGQFDAGLLFLSYQKDPQAFIDIQNAFGNNDKMNEYITHIGSGLFACFAGVRNEQDYLGKALLG